MPIVEFEDLDKANETLFSQIRRKGCVVIKNVVDDAEATKWKDDLREYVKTNPVNGELVIMYLLNEMLFIHGLGAPEEDKQFFQL